MSNIYAAMGAGRGRQPFRIAEFLAAKGMNQVGIARKLELSPSLVSRTIRGNINNARVLTYLRDLGCPEKFLSLPEHLKDGRAA